MSCNANFWAHYNAAQTWTRFHQFAAQKAYERTRRMYGVSDVDSSKLKRRDLRRKNCKKSRPPVKSEDGLCCEQQNSSNELASIQVDEDIEMDANMIEFFRQTLEHRKQRDAERRKDEQHYTNVGHWAMTGDDEYVLAEEVGIHGIAKPSVEMPNVAEEFEERKKLMQKLYGNDADKITAMETFLDMRLEQYLDKYKPQLWPSIPLKL